MASVSDLEAWLAGASSEAEDEVDGGGSASTQRPKSKAKTAEVRAAIALVCFFLDAIIEQLIAMS